MCESRCSTSTDGRTDMGIDHDSIRSTKAPESEREDKGKNEGGGMEREK